MDEKLKHVIITGIFSVIAAIIGIFAIAPALNNNNVVTVNVNGDKTVINQNEYQKMYDELYQQYTTLKNSFDRLEGEKNDLSNQNDSLKNNLSEVNSKNDKLEGEKNDLSNQNDSLKNNLSEANSKNDKLSNELDACKSNTSTQNTINQTDNSTIASVYMLDVVPAYQSRDYEEYISSDGKGRSFSMGGKKYYDGCIWSGYGNAFSIYGLDKKYTNISGILGHVDETSMTGNTLQIYLDGKPPQEITLTGDMIPYEININVTNITQLKIVCYGMTYDSQLYGIGDLKIR